MAAGFHDVRFPVSIALGAVGGPAYSTTVVTGSSGWESRVQNWASGRLEWTVARELAGESEWVELLAFFRARKGSAYGFRFKDWSDFYVGMSYVANVLSYTSVVEIGTGDTAETEFQLVKLYTDAGGSESRKITRPVAATVKVYLDEVLQTLTTHYTLNASTGVVTFVTPPGAGVSVGWAGQFDVPVRFGDDAMRVSLDGVRLGAWDGIRIVEIRE